MTKLEKAMCKIEQDLKSHAIEYELMGKKLIDTQNCTITVYVATSPDRRKTISVEVNEKPVGSADEVIWEVLAVEQPTV